MSRHSLVAPQRRRGRHQAFFSAPNFSLLVVADAGADDAVSAVGEVAAYARFAETFSGESDAGHDEVRRYFMEKAVLTGQDRVAPPLVDLDGRRLRRAVLGLPANEDAPHRRGGCRTRAPGLRPSRRRRHAPAPPRPAAPRGRRRA